MKTKLLLLLFSASFFMCSCNQKEKAIIEEQAQRIDSLESKLEECQNSIGYLLFSDALMNSTYEDVDVLTHEGYRDKYYKAIKEKSLADYKAALKLSNAVDSFNDYCQDLKEELIERSGGLNNKGVPVNKANKDITNRMFLDEGKGQELKKKIDELRKNLRSLVASDFNSSVLALGGVDMDVGKPWEEYMFKDMPMAAVIPMLSSHGTNAKADELKVLKYLSLK